jgi:serine/threonine-protein kinase RIO1
MDLIGDADEPSPRLKDITVDDPLGLFEDLLEILAVIWQTCDLAHADFSEYNILWYDGEPWVIDVGQAVVSAHPNSSEFLVRDVTRLVQWINRQGYNINLADSLLRVLEDPVPEYPALPGGD